MGYVKTEHVKMFYVLNVKNLKFLIYLCYTKITTKLICFLLIIFFVY